MSNFNDPSKHLIALSSNNFKNYKRSDYIIVTWRLLLRCNYDCSYCSPILHDLTSDIPSNEMLTNAVNIVNARAKELNKKVYYFLTGGEPYLIKDLNNFLAYIRSLSQTLGINVSSNASVPYKIYEQSLAYVTHLILSLHIEVDIDAVDAKVDRIIKLSQLDQEKTVVMIMLEKGFFEQAKAITQKLKQHNVKFWLKLVQPQLSVDLITFNPPMNPGKYVSIKGKDNLSDNYGEVINTYYSQEELDIALGLISDEDKSTATCLWSDKTITEESITEILTVGANSFKGWTCSAGLLQIEILHDGEMYVGMCMANGSFGNLYKNEISWPTKQIICPINYCVCTTDVAVPKQQIKS